MDAKPKPAGGELFGLQMLRAVAASAVLFHHTLEESNGAARPFSPDWLTTFGAAGVDIFFVISGFIMLYTSFRPDRPPISPGTFLYRRATRIYPLYWACCLVMLAILSVGLLANHRLAPGEVALSLALLPSSKLILTVSWTLVYEIYFYAIFATMLLFRSIWIAAIGTTAALVALNLAGNAIGPGTLRHFLTNPIAAEFALGLWLAVGFKAATASGRRWAAAPVLAAPALLMVAAAPLFVAHANTGGLDGWPRVLAWGLPAVLIVAAFLSVGPPINAFQRRLVFLGDASYALYLTHGFVMIGYALAVKTTPLGQAPQVLLAPLVVLAAIVAGVVAHLTVEKSLLQAIRRFNGPERSSRRGVKLGEARVDQGSVST